MQELAHEDLDSLFLEHLRRIAHKFSIPYNGFGEYTIKVKIQDNKLTITEFSGTAKIKP